MTPVECSQSLHASSQQDFFHTTNYFCFFHLPGFKKSNSNMHYLKLDPVFPLVCLKESSCFHSLLRSFRICPLSVTLAYFFGTFQKMATRRQARSKIEYQDSSLLITPHLCIQHLQEHMEAPFSPKHFKVPQLSRKAEGIVYVDQRISIPFSQSPSLYSYYCKLSLWI